jgi:hypothetical protein
MRTARRTSRVSRHLIALAIVSTGCATGSGDEGRQPSSAAEAARSRPLPLDRLADTSDPDVVRRAFAALESVRPWFLACGDRVRSSGALLQRAVSVTVVVRWSDGSVVVSGEPTGVSAKIDACFAEALAVAQVDLMRSWPLGIPPVSFSLCVAPPVEPWDDRGAR